MGVAEFAKKVSGATGWNGIFEEMGEEVVSAFMRAVDPGLPEYTMDDVLPDGDEFLQQLVGFAPFVLLGGAARGAGTYRRQRATQKKREEKKKKEKRG